MLENRPQPQLSQTAMTLSQRASPFLSRPPEHPRHQACLLCLGDSEAPEVTLPLRRQPTTPGLQAHLTSAAGDHHIVLGWRGPRGSPGREGPLPRAFL